MHMYLTQSATECAPLLLKQFSDFDLIDNKVIDGVTISITQDARKTIDIHLNNIFYGKIYLTAKWSPTGMKGPFICASQIVGSEYINTVDLFDIYPNLKDTDFTLTLYMLKQLVVTQLKKSFPTAGWPNPILNASEPLEYSNDMARSCYAIRRETPKMFKVISDSNNGAYYEAFAEIWAVKQALETVLRNSEFPFKRRPAQQNIYRKIYEEMAEQLEEHIFKTTTTMYSLHIK